MAFKLAFVKKRLSTPLLVQYTDFSIHIAYLRTKTLPSPTKPTLHDPEVIVYLEQLHRRFVIVPIDKAANNFAFIVKCPNSYSLTGKFAMKRVSYA